MMGAGKSSVGECLHRRTGLAVRDTDQIVTAQLGMSVAEIFAKHGEEVFREAESAALRGVRSGERMIIVTGGGIVLRSENIEMLRNYALIVWLDGDEKTLFERASHKQNRPLLRTKNPKKTFQEIFRSRKPLYASVADIRVDTSVLTDEEAAVAVLAKIRNINSNTERNPST
jgi:shikimate kinase